MLAFFLEKSRFRCCIDISSLPDYLWKSNADVLKSDWNMCSPYHNGAAEAGARGVSLLTLDANKQKALIYMCNKPYTRADILREMENDATLAPTEKRDAMTKVLNGRWFSAALDVHLEQ